MWLNIQMQKCKLVQERRNAGLKKIRTKFIQLLAAAAVALSLVPAALAAPEARGGPAPAQGFTQEQRDWTAERGSFTGDSPWDSAPLVYGENGAQAANLAAAGREDFRADKMETSRVFYVVATDGMCLVIVLLVMTSLFINARLLSRAALSFLGICGAAVLRFVSDALENMVNGRGGEALQALHEIASFLIAVSVGLIFLTLCLFLYRLGSERRKVKTFILWSGLACTIVFFAAAVASHFNGMAYFIDPANVYHRGWATPWLFGLVLLCILAVCLWLTQMRKAFAPKELTVLLVALSIPVIGMMVQFFKPEISPLNAFITVGICAAFLSLQSNLLESERLGRIRSQTELEGIGEIFTGVYHWNPRAGGMESSVTEPEYAPFLVDGRLNWAAFIENAVHPADRDRVREFLSGKNLRAISASPEKLLREAEYRETGAHEGEWRRISLIHLPEEPRGQGAQLYMVFQDITYEKRLAEHSNAQRRRFVGAAAGLYTDICEWNMNDDSALRLVITPDGVTEKPVEMSWSDNLRHYRAECVAPEDYELFDRVLPENVRKQPAGTTISCSFRIISGGKYHWNAVTIKIFGKDNGAGTAMYMQQDIDASVREHNYLRDRSEHDAMTDLFNRAKLDAMKKEEYSAMESCGVMFLDINNLKMTNDSLGHAAGDALIMLAAESVRSITNRRVMAYRLGGDELLVVAENCTREEFAQMQSMWRSRLDLLNRTAQVRCSVAMGSAWKDGGVLLDELIKAADTAMYRQKKAMKVDCEGQNLLC